MFHHGIIQGEVSSEPYPTDPAEYLRGRWGPTVEVRKTELVIKPRSPTIRVRPPRDSVTHSLVNLQKQSPHVIFVATIDGFTLTERFRVKEMEYDLAHSELRDQLKGFRHLDDLTVGWESIPERWKKRIRRDPFDCWVWRSKEAPYREIYRKLKGQIPQKVLLRHTCDNRRCVNPNHLLPGTIRDNNRDTRRHGRLHQQKRRTLQIWRLVTMLNGSAP